MENYDDLRIVKRDSGTVILEVYSLNSEWHRLDGPAYTVYYDNGNVMYSVYRLKGLLHRVDGPAFTKHHADGTIYDVEYFILGHELTKEQFEAPGFIDAFILSNS